MRDAARQVLPQVEVVPSANPTDLTFCREQGYLHVEDLAPLLGMCRTAFEESRGTAVASPHARFDVQEWLPLES